MKNKTSILIYPLLLMGVLLMITISCKKDNNNNNNNNNNSTVTDKDGNVYHTVTIGTQVWMAENLNYTSSGSWCYDNSISNCAKYGRLYDWETAKKVCPSGWHLPSDAEWTTLTTYLGGESVAGGKLKEAGYTHWQSPNNGADNSSGFGALPGGCLGYSGPGSSVGGFGYWWSSTEYDTNHAWSRYMYYGGRDVSRNDNNKPYGYSVRCVRD